MATKLKTTEQDFFQIKANLKDYMRNQTEFADYDFDGSTLSHLLDVLAYNTHYSALTANMSVNEMFLDTAVIRNNVVSHAKGLGYTPLSMKSSIGVVSVTGTTSSTTEVVIPRGSIFSSASSKFVSLTDYSGTPVGGTVTWTGIDLYEGKLLKNTFVVGGEEQVYEIPNKNVDTTTLRIKIKDTVASTTWTEYKLAKYLTDVTDTSALYFLQEGRDEKFEITFGDGILGTKLSAGNIMEVEYVRCNGVEGDGVSSFTMGSTISGLTGTTVTTETKSGGGGSIESMDSIKLNAPFNYTAQNRAVTAADYSTLIQQIYPNVDAISVWGGEDNDPQVYGKVFASIKPSSGVTLTSDAKASITTSLKAYRVMSIIPEIVDPEYLYLLVDVVFKYNSGVTTLTSSELKTKVQTSISSYNSGQLLSFNKMFRHSVFSAIIDSTDSAIVSSISKVKVKQYKIPVLNTVSKYDFDFGNTFYHPHSGHMPGGYGVVRSNGFMVFGNETVIYYMEDDGAGNIILFHKESGATTNTIDNSSFGSVDYILGKISIPELSISSIFGTDENLSFTVELDSNDVVPVRNQIIQIETSTVSASEDTVASGTYSGNVNYKTTPSRY